MDLLSIEDCQKIAKKCYPTKNVQVLSYEMRLTTDAEAGFISSTNLLYITVNVDGQIAELNFFLKTLPENQYHRKNVEISRVFYKEVEFFRSIWPNVCKYFAYKTTPICYHADPEKLLVLENLSRKNYKNVNARELFDVPHCQAVLKILASFHAASFLYEKEKNSTIAEMYPDLGCDRINWFKDEKGHPGYEHCQVGVRAMGVVLDRHFNSVPVEIRNKVKNLLASNPSFLLPSKVHRNALSHSDLWCNNLMFHYDDEGKIDDCVLVDFQLFGYCPPATDVYSMIFIVTDKKFRAKHSAELAEFYYSHFAECLRRNGADPDELLSWGEFQNSVPEVIRVALTNAPIFLHYVLLPEKELADVFSDVELTKKFMEVDRSEIVLRAVEENRTYRDRLFASLNDCIDYFNGNLVI
ncbi:unnamed protein product [Nesidiocoris tenuis]|uniref:CHK kinase-like domain-containing protein n=1 Tax=Nesidiocoris tenuis TaxID=355587 RepID=A0A6H5GPL4_9HEMI|nr:unnamed protein product [Nesidiocoris tenuis]